MKRREGIAALIVLVVVFCFAMTTYADEKEVVVTNTPLPVVVSENRSQVEFFFSAAFGEGQQTVYTVPEGKKFVLTDAIFNHELATTAGVNGANVLRGTLGGGQELFRAFVVDQENVILHFQTGFEFGPGEEVIYITGGTASASVHVTLVGYESDL